MTATIAKTENPNGTTEDRAHRWLRIDAGDCVYCRLTRAIKENGTFEYLVDGWFWVKKVRSVFFASRKGR